MSAEPRSSDPWLRVLRRRRPSSPEEVPRACASASCSGGARIIRIRAPLQRKTPARSMTAGHSLFSTFFSVAASGGKSPRASIVRPHYTAMDSWSSPATAGATVSGGTLRLPCVAICMKLPSETPRAHPPEPFPPVRPGHSPDGSIAGLQQVNQYTSSVFCRLTRFRIPLRTGQFRRRKGMAGLLTDRFSPSV